MEMKCDGSFDQVKPLRTYGPRDANVKVIAGLVKTLEDVGTGQRPKLIIIFKNVDLKGNRKHEETGKPLTATQVSEDEDENDGNCVQDLFKTSGCCDGDEKTMDKGNQKSMDRN